MLENSYTLQVDVANNGTLVPQVVNRHDATAGYSTYIGEDHSLSQRDIIQFYRSPVAKGLDGGRAKSKFKITEDLEVIPCSGTCSVLTPMIGEVSFSLPILATDAQILELRQRMIAVLDNDALMSKLNQKLEI